MNEFLEELKLMKTSDFWQQFLSRELSTRRARDAKKTREMSESVFELKSPKLSFNSSAFFDPKTHPTINDQVFLCREIAKQLVSDETNAKSKGREMFEKRVEKSYNWVTTGDDGDDDVTSRRTTISEGPPNLRLVLDPRHVQDLNSLSFDSNEKEMQREEKRTRDLCEGIVADLTSPEINPNKGNVLFAKRQQKSDEWIVDDYVAVVTPTTTPKTTPMDDRTTAATSPTTKRTTLCDTSESTFSIVRKYRDFNCRAKPFSRSQ